MLLQHIVEKLDAELTRLRTLREIVSGLQSSAINLVPDPVQVVQETALAVSAAQPVVTAPLAHTVPQPVRRLRRSHGPRTTPHRNSRRPDEAAPALAKAIPSGPVVVSPAALAKERAARAARPPEMREVAPRPEPGSLGALIRSLELRSAHLS